MKKLFTLLLACVLLCSLIPASHVMADDHITDMEEIPVDETTMESDFADDSIMVVLNNEASLSMEDYDALDFAEIGCSSVTDLTSTTTALVRAELTGADTASVLNIEPGTTVSDDFFEVEPETFNKVLCLNLKDPGKENVLAAIKLLSKRVDVIYAGPDYIMTLDATTPNDSYYSQQWAAPKIKLPEAWDISRGSASVMVGVIDTGIDASHPDLQGRVDSELSRVITKTYITKPYSVTDYNGHGTHVAGIIGAIGHNNAGICGTAWSIKLVSLQTFDSSQEGLSSSVATAIDYAKSVGIPILNLSASWSTAKNNIHQYDQALETVIKNYPGLFVCSAGNDSKNNDTQNAYPANYHLSNLISVGASTRTDTIATFSNTGKKNVDIFAPGVDILSCYPMYLCNNGHPVIDSSKHNATGYHRMDGTSMAAPYVAGVAALIRAKYPNATATSIKQCIMSSVDIVYNSNGVNVFGDSCVSGGRLNAYKAINNYS